MTSRTSAGMPPALAEKDLSAMSRDELMAHAVFYRRRAESFRALLMKALLIAGLSKRRMHARADGRRRLATAQ